MQKQAVYPGYFITGAFVIYFTFYVLPSLLGIAYSFTDWSAYSEDLSFIGFENFRVIFGKGDVYLLYIKNTLLFTIVTTVFKTLLGLWIALVLVKLKHFKDFYRSIIFLPSILSPLVVGIIFNSILNPGIGLLNESLRAVNLDALALSWLTDPKIAFSSVMAVDIWKGTGYIMTIIVAGIMYIPSIYYEAADIDGANLWQKFHYITFPFLIPSLTITTVLNVIYGLKVFDMVYALTNGGPGYTTEVLYTGVFREFAMGRFAVGTALSSVLFVFMAAIGFFIIKLMTSQEVVKQ